jgi:hypothetical protein
MFIINNNTPNRGMKYTETFVEFSKIVPKLISESSRHVTSINQTMEF